MGQLIRQIKKKNGLIRRFAEEEDAVGKGVGPDR